MVEPETSRSPEELIDVVPVCPTRRELALNIEAKRFVEDELVNIAVEGVVPPIGVLLIVPPDIVRSSATLPSARVPVQPRANWWLPVPEVIVRVTFVSSTSENV